MELITVRRDNVNAYYTPQHFWSLAASGSFLRSDLMYNHASGRFLPTNLFANPESYLPPKGLSEIIQDLVVGVAVGTIIVGVGVAVLTVLEGIFSPPQPARKTRRKSPNNEPLEAWKREFVRLRDGEVCSYCGLHNPWGHVDHKTSRANGGSNLLRNLTWACISCNCSKGKRNAREFRILMGG